MSFFTDLHAAIDALAEDLGAEIEASDLPATVIGLDDGRIEAVIRRTTSVSQGIDCIRSAAAGVTSVRSSREAGQGGMAQKRGQHNAVSFIQDLTGVTRAEATKQVRLGEALLATVVPAGANGCGEAGDNFDSPPRAARRWHCVLSEAFLAGTLTADQKNAILRGLGEPPIDHPGVDVGSIVEAWTTAAEHLVGEARERTPEELLQAARSVRDILDPADATRRFDERFRRRLFRTWTDSDGGKHARIDFDDEMGAWVQAIIGAALRPRRGGPRFVDADEAARATELENDPRTNDQLTYDLMMDVIRAGALADAEQVFGTRQAGIRLIVTRDAVVDDEAGVAAVAVLEDDGATMPAWLARQRECDGGVSVCTFDDAGNPLDVGREQRLFTPKQRIALAIRDGGCRWRGCDRPASYCESHHIDPWAGGGKTDVDRGILLCRYHHMALHHGGWRIARSGKDDFVLHPPPDAGSPIVLAPRVARRYALGDLAPPARRFRPAA